MDELDYLILNALQEDGRTPFTQIAKKAGVAESTIRSRYANLVDQGIVQTIAVIDPFAVAEALENLTEVSYLVLTLGGYDLVLEVFCRDREHLTKFITNQIQDIPGVRSTETLVIGQIFKLSFFWHPENHLEGQKS